MKTITVNISKIGVYDEVAKTTSYIGAKSVNENIAYNNVFTTDDDVLMLERFFNEAASSVISRIGRYIQSSGFTPDTGDLAIKLKLSSRSNDALVATVGNSLFSYFANFITGKWMQFINGESASIYLGLADVSMSEILSMLSMRTRE